VGFQEWSKFGAPLGAPGQQVHHPGVKEHELIAWLLTMHFLTALEMIALDDSNDSLQCQKPVPPTFPRPNATLQPWSSIMFGEQVGSKEEWRMNRVHCRTSYEPIKKKPGVLHDIIVSGSVGEEVNVMFPKSNQYYNRGWVLDLSDSERKAKHRLNFFGGLGFVDSKKAYYGIYTSGPLRMLLPHDTAKAGDDARKWFKSVVVCQVNEKREAGACDAETDAHFFIDRVNVTDAVVISAAGTIFMGKKLCIFLPVPPTATLTTREKMKKDEDKPILVGGEEQEDQVGLMVEVEVHNKKIMKAYQACSVSHVVWEDAQQ
jgi:hypothetical protein